VFAQYSLLAADRDSLERALEAEGIPTAIHYPKSLHQQPAYASGWQGASFPVSERLARERRSSAHRDGGDDALLEEALHVAVRRGAGPVSWQSHDHRSHFVNYAMELEATGVFKEGQRSRRCFPARFNAFPGLRRALDGH
jgi:hypothetical protein